MNNFDLIKIQAHEFQADNSLVDEVLAEVKTLNYYDNANNQTSKDFYYNSNMFTWFNSCLETTKNLYFNKDLNLEITDCWANKSTKLQGHHIHSHPNSIVSGIFYLTTHEECETVFYYPNPWVDIHRTGFLKICDRDLSSYNCKNSSKPVAGKLLLFPSHVEHGVRVNKETNNRYTVAFNTFISGSVSSVHSAKLNIHSISPKQSTE